MRSLTFAMRVRALLSLVVVCTMTLMHGCGLGEYESRMDQRRNELSNAAASDADTEEDDSEPVDDDVEF